jgi:hypothetical protein
MNSKFLLPWKEGMYKSYSRRNIYNTEKFLIIHYNDLYYWGNKFWFDTKEECMSHLDTHLISIGYIFLTNKQAEKLKVLL